jgi:hypothetical protein
MDVTNSVEPTVVAGGQAIAFEVIAAGRVVKCMVSRESLQHFFWLQLWRVRCTRAQILQ